MQNNHFETKPKWIWIIVTVVVSIGMMGGSYFLAAIAFESKYVDLGQLIMGIILFLLGFIFFVTIPYYYPKIKIEGNIVTIKSWLLNKSFLLDDIISFELEAKSSEYGLYKWQELMIYWGTDKYNVNSWAFSNFETLKEQLIKDKKEGKPSILKGKRIDWGLIFVIVIFGSAIAWMMSFLINPDTYLIDKNQLNTVKGIIKMRPTIESNGQDDNKIEVQLLEYPDFTFKLQTKPFEATNVFGFIQDVKANDTISIDVKKEDFNRKIKQTEPLSFWDKHYRYEFIDIYGLSFKDTQYLSIEEHNRLERKEAGWLKYAVIAMSLLFIYLIYAQWKSNSDETSKVK